LAFKIGQKQAQNWLLDSLALTGNLDGKLSPNDLEFALLKKNLVP